MQALQQKAFVGQAISAAKPRQAANKRAPVAVKAAVDGSGKLNVGIGQAWDTPMVAQSMRAPLPAAALELPPLSTIATVGGRPAAPTMAVTTAVTSGALATASKAAAPASARKHGV